MCAKWMWDLFVLFAQELKLYIFVMDIRGYTIELDVPWVLLCERGEF